MSTALRSPRISSLPPLEVLAQGRPHGDRIRYRAGCRCFHCRRANSDYERQRLRARASGDWNGIVDADEARAHLRKLARQGVGYKIAAEASGVAPSAVMQIRSGRITRIRARTARRLLAVTTECRGDKAIVDAAPTWRLIRQLLEEGYTKTRLARELGMRTKALQIHPERVTVRTAARVVAMHRRLTT